MYKNEVYLKNYFLSHRLVTRDLISYINEGSYSYRPTETSMTAAELVEHMLTTAYQFAAMAAEKDPAPLHEEREQLSLEAMAERYTSETVRLIETMDTEHLEKEIDLSSTLGVKAPAWKVVEMMIDHEINHKGNLFVYIRELGHTELPMFVKA
ncbi:DinB family protein [Alkalicoccus chagannorensis]|uniref:DinB family protein n=1 Tax=Alkalicoccus chagannorensis TaxID=427072 RepID=UPI0003F98966|nr:DinB family protein [Alkalicoccus chagannorensis]